MSESRSPVIPANLVETLPELHPFTEKGTRNRRVEVFDEFDTLAAANYRQKALFALSWRGYVNERPRSTGNKLIGERRLLIIVSNGELAP